MLNMPYINVVHKTHKAKVLSNYIPSFHMQHCNGTSYTFLILQNVKHDPVGFDLTRETSPLNSNFLPNKTYFGLSVA